MVPCPSGGPKLLPRFPQLCHTISSSPQAVFRQPIPVLSVTSGARASVPSPNLSQQADRKVLGWEVLATTNPLCRSLSTLPSTYLLLHSSLRLQSAPFVPTSEGTSQCVEAFPFSRLPPRGTAPVLITFSLFFLSLPYLIMQRLP